MEMEVEKLSDFLKNCCRVCLSVENEMVDSSNIVENFNKTIDQLLFECVNLKMSNDNSHPNKLCDDCTTELVMVAKFREKCDMSAAALDQLKRQINRKNKSEEISSTSHTDTDTNNDEFYENLEYTEENVEYVIYDTTADLIEETDVQDRSQDTVQSDEVEMDVEEDQTTYELNQIEATSRRKRANAKKKATSTLRTAKQNKEADSRTEAKSSIKYHCKQCGAGFAQMNNYFRHLQTHNDSEIETELILSDDHSTFDVESSIEVSTEDSQIGDECDILDTNSSEQQAKGKKILQKNHTCQYCGRAFPSGSLLSTHIRIHTGERPFVCCTCSKSFKTQGALDLHSRRHSGVKPYKCTVCSRGFVESSNLKVHMRTHTGEKPHRCITCGRSFSRVFLLQIHQRTHTGEKPYQCGVCGKSFAQQGDLAAHKRIHSGERPHRCNVCQKGFIKSSGLTQHMRRHFRPGKTNPSTSANNDPSEEIDNIGIAVEENMQKSEKIMICYKEYNENSESLDEYSENC